MNTVSKSPMSIPISNVVEQLKIFISLFSDIVIFSINSDYVLMMNDKALAGKNGADYDKLSYDLFEGKLIKTSAS